MTERMNPEFDPQRDFSLPIGLFVERLLGDDIPAQAKENAAQMQALLVVYNDYLIPKEQADDPTMVDANAKQKSDFMFQNMHRPYDDLAKEVLDIIPAEIDVEQSLKDARGLVDRGQGVPNPVPGFGMLLSKQLSRDTINSCLQVQAGLRLMAINNEWDGNDKIVAPRIFPNDPKQLNDVQNVLIDVHKNYLQAVAAGTKLDYKVISSIPFSRTVGLMAITDAKDTLIKQGNEDAAEKLQHYIDSETGVEKNYTYEQAVTNYYDVANGRPRSFKPGASF
jgi:hypothetical protein